MNQSAPSYDSTPALSLIEPWLTTHLPDLAPAARRHFIQLVSGMFESRSLLMESIATSSGFRANPSSNVTQVRRILRDHRLTMERVYYPFIRSILATVPGTDLYLTVDATSHGADYNVMQVGWATDGMSLPLAMFVYAPDAAWADETRALMTLLDGLIPDQFTVTLLADRGFTGEPLVTWLDGLSWNYIIRAPEHTQIEHPTKGWLPLRRVYKRANQARFFDHVRVWKQGQWRGTVSIYKYERPGFRPVIWYLISNLDAARTQFAEYATRWWAECTFKFLKSGQFDWERGRVTDPHRVGVLLMGVSCALWALWLLGRAYERIPKANGTTTRPQRRRRRLMTDGYHAFLTACKQGQALQMPAPQPPRVWDYEQVFTR
jgi:hypothetical protein